RPSIHRALPPAGALDRPPLHHALPHEGQLDRPPLHHALPHEGPLGRAPLPPCRTKASSIDRLSRNESTRGTHRIFYVSPPRAAQRVRSRGASPRGTARLRRATAARTGSRRALAAHRSTNTRSFTRTPELKVTIASPGSVPVGYWD